MSLYLWNGVLLIRTINGVTGLATSEACCCGGPTYCQCPSDVADWLERCLRWEVDFRMGISGLCECAGAGPHYVINLLEGYPSPLTFGVSDTMIGTCEQAFAIFITCEEGMWRLVVNNGCYDGGTMIATKPRSATQPWPWGDYTITTGGSGTVTVYPPTGWTDVEGCDNCD